MREITMNKVMKIMKSIMMLFSILLFLTVLFIGSQLFLSDLNLTNIIEGEVINKNFNPAHSETTMLPIVTTDGENISTIIMPYVYHYPNTYKITIRNYIANKEQTATYRVTKEVYDSVNIGDEFIYTEEYEPNEPEYIREKQENDKNKDVPDIT